MILCLRVAYTHSNTHTNSNTRVHKHFGRDASLWRFGRLVFFILATFSMHWEYVSAPQIAAIRFSHSSDFGQAGGVCVCAFFSFFFYSYQFRPVAVFVHEHSKSSAGKKSIYIPSRWWSTEHHSKKSNSDEKKDDYNLLCVFASNMCLVFGLVVACVWLVFFAFIATFYYRVACTFSMSANHFWPRYTENLFEPNENFFSMLLMQWREYFAVLGFCSAHTLCVIATMVHFTQSEREWPPKMRNEKKRTVLSEWNYHREKRIAHIHTHTQIHGELKHSKRAS